MAFSRRFMTTWPIWAGSAFTSGRLSASFISSPMPLNASCATSESAISETGWLMLIFSGLITVSRPKLSSCRTMVRARFVSRAMSFSFSWRGSPGGHCSSMRFEKVSTEVSGLLISCAMPAASLPIGGQLFRLHELVLFFLELLDDLLQRGHGMVQLVLHLVEGFGKRARSRHAP